MKTCAGCVHCWNFEYTSMYRYICRCSLVGLRSVSSVCDNYRSRKDKDTQLYLDF